ncbi:MAG: SpoIIE family protein phosphatase [Lachnospiraceae bacterium]|nr:SpoIIE family protein phosphatase [Lachnospiraceae bacterium]
MLNVRMSKASREAGNKSGVIEGNLFSGYSKRKLYCLSETYEELARLYRGIPQADRLCDDRKDMLYRKQLQEAKEVFANHLDEIADAFADVADTVVHVSIPVEHKRKALIQHLKRQGIIVRGLVFIEGDAAGSCEYGQSIQRGSRISIEARIAGKHTVSASVLGAFLSAFFDRKLVPSGESALVIDRGYKIFIYEDEPRYTVLSAVSRAVREDEKISGDNFSMEEYNQSQMIVMLADGMGSGAQACKDSQAVIEFMERFLEAGFQKERAFSMVNGAIASQNGCCNLTTLDICAMDLLTGEAEFVKAGAAASYIKRGNWVDEVAADTLPLGSLDQLCPIIQNVKLEDTDMLIMLSDGISDAIENEAVGRLREIISRSRIENPKEMADYLLRYAISSQGGHIRDDMTVLTCCIKRRIGV